MGSTLIYTSLSTCTSTRVFSKTHLPTTLVFPNDEIQSIVNSTNLYSKQIVKNSKKTKPIKATVSTVETTIEVSKTAAKRLKVLVAGGGIGGLVFALAAKKKGFEVMVFEKDLSAIRGEGQYRGPIQIQSNALAALEAIDMDVAEQVMAAGCVTGDRINGLVDGVSGNWYVKFDTFTPAVERGLPVTRVISRMTLQQILARAVGEELIMNESNVVDFKDDGNKVTVTLENGKTYEGDLLVGADGRWYKVRRNLFGLTEPVYSGYTCCTGIADFIPADIDSVGYRVFLGHKQYFVSSDVGGSKMQWYAFHNESPVGVDPPNVMKGGVIDYLLTSLLDFIPRILLNSALIERQHLELKC